MCDRPARRAPDETELALQREFIEFVHDAVDIERQRVALRTDAPVIIKTAFDIVGDAGELADRQTPVAQLAQRRRMRRWQCPPFDYADRVRIKRERALRGDARIELAQ